MSKKELNVAIYKPTHRGLGYYRHALKPLFHILKNHTEDEKIKAYRATKTKETPKGDGTLKRRIKAFMPSGDYGEDVARSTKNKLTIETGLVQLDFDQTVKSDEVIKLFEKYKWIAVAGKSCGGGGFYLLVNTPTSEHYDQYWQALYEFFSTTKYKVDPAVSSVNEIRYFSLTTDVLIRENSEVWKKRAKKEKSNYLGRAIPHNNKLIGLDDGALGTLHYVDLVALAGLNNSNGTPMVETCAYFKPEMFSGDSHLSKVTKSQLTDIVQRVYERYADQYGATIVPVIKSSGSISLPLIDIVKKSSTDYKSYQVVQNIFEAYLLKTDEHTKITYRYNGKYWEEIGKSELRNFLSACATASGMDALLNELTTFRDRMEEQLKDLTAIRFEVPTNKFNLANGVIEFINGGVTFSEHSDSHLFTYCLDYDYTPKATPSKLLSNFLNRTIPDEASLVTFFQYIGSAFITDFKIELFLILIGSGANGKSTLINLLKDVFGGAVGEYSLDQLTDPDGERSAKQARFIYNKLLGVSAEDSKIKDPRLWRKIVSKETIEVKLLFKDTFETSNYGKLISCMNEMPIMDAIEGSIRRMVVLKTGLPLKREEYDLGLGVKLKADRAAFVNLIIIGYQEAYRSQGVVVVSELSKESTRELIDYSDNVISFIKYKKMVPLEKPTGKLLTKREVTVTYKYAEQNKKLIEVMSATPPRFDALDKLYTEFRSWCEEGGITNIMQRKTFSKRLRSIDCQRLNIDGNGMFHSYMASDRKEYWYYIIDNR